MESDYHATMAKIRLRKFPRPQQIQTLTDNKDQYHKSKIKPASNINKRPR